MTRYDIDAFTVPAVAYVTKGLAAVTAQELTTLTPHVSIDRSADRFLTATIDLRSLDTWVEKARTIDDLRVLVVPLTKVRTPDELAQACQTAEAAITALLGPDRRDAPWSVTISAKNPFWARGKNKWDPAPTFRRHLHAADPASTERSPVDVRVQMDADVLHMSVNVTDAPIGKRAAARYAGALRPTVAAAMVWLATDGLAAPTLHHGLYDPTCGSGTILLEARLHGLPIFGSDIDVNAVALARTRIGPTLSVTGDERRSALQHRLFVHDILKPEDPRTARASLVVANLPWGKQVPVERRSELFGAAARLVATRISNGGRAVLLTTHEEQCAAALRRATNASTTTMRVGLLGQTPAIVIVRPT